MFGRQITLFRLFGFKIQIDMSWIVLAVLIVWSLAQGLFPGSYGGLPASAYWIMGALGALGLFASVVFHELSHSLVSRRFGLPITGITLFIFGGVAQMEEEPPNARAEFTMAIAGPLSSLVLAGILYLAELGLRRAGAGLAVIGVVSYLWTINLLLAGFNILPAFPLDGGRVLRSILWRWKGNLRWATHIASQIGSFFGIALMVVGFYYVFRGSLLSGLWWVVIGLFLRNASQQSYRRLLITEALAGEPVRRFMKADPVTVTPDTPVQSLVEDYVYRYHFKMYPVVEGDRLTGCVTTREVKEVPREEWAQRRVGEIARNCGPDNTIGADADATEALAKMSRTANSRLMVVEEGRLVGIIALKDLLKFLSLKLDLEGEDVRDLTRV